MNSKIALSPDASETARCSVAFSSSCPGKPPVAMTKGADSMPATASFTVAKLSSTYCVHTAIDMPGLVPSHAGYSDSASQSKFAASPLSFIPSVVPTSKAAVTTLPYFDVHLYGFFVVCPVRAIPRGKTQRLLLTSELQSIERAVITALSPWNMTRVQASAVVPVRRPDRKRVVEGKSVSVRVDLGGRCIMKQKNKVK